MAATTMHEMLGISGKFRNWLLHGYEADLALTLAVQEGLPAQAVRKATKEFALPASVVDSIISRRTLERREKEGRSLTTDESDRLVRVVLIMTRAIETFGSQERALEWMKAPNRALEGRTPLSVINTGLGVELVQRILGRIDHGVFS